MISRLAHWVCVLKMLFSPCYDIANNYFPDSFEGGVALVYVSQPLDTVKVKMQAFPTVYKGMMDCLTETFRKDGVVRGLYAGTLPAIAANVAENSVLFVGNDQKPLFKLSFTCS